ncbi:MAG: hypothetical protein ACTSQE_03255 [Candidatus Heimdallarchaeaceae archaeon]
MEFCENCGKMLIPQKKGKKRVLVCPRCKKEKEIKDTSRYEIEEEVSHKSSELVDIIFEEDEKEISEAEKEARRERFVEGIDFFNQ